MRSVAAILGLVIALGGGFYVYQTYLTSSPLAQAPPQEQIDVVGIRAELLTIGQAERQYLITHSTYGTLEQLQEESLLSSGADRRGYTFTAVADGSSGFTVTAAPSTESKAGFPTLTIDQSMQVTER